MARIDDRLNAIVDAGVSAGSDLARLAREAAKGGATLIQYRDKNAPARLMIERAEAIRSALQGTGAVFVINDRVDIALAVGADGVHLGREDMDAVTARRLLGTHAIIGLTVKNEADASIAGAAPIDYACIGGVFETVSKHNCDPPVGLNGFAHLRSMLASKRPDMPVGAIAGVTLARVPDLIEAGADGVAAISAIFRAGDVRMAASAFREAVDRALNERSQRTVS